MKTKILNCVTVMHVHLHYENNPKFQIVVALMKAKTRICQMCQVVVVVLFAEEVVSISSTEIEEVIAIESDEN